MLLRCRMFISNIDVHFLLKHEYPFNTSSIEHRRKSDVKNEFRLFFFHQIVREHLPMSI